jgi:hypothetical protein
MDNERRADLGADAVLAAARCASHASAAACSARAVSRGAACAVAMSSRSRASAIVFVRPRCGVRTSPNPAPKLDLPARAVAAPQRLM